MHVCFVVGTLGRGGAERQLIYMLRALKREGVKTTLLCLTSGEALENDVRELGVEIIWVGSSPIRLLRLWKIIHAARKCRADIIQSSHFYTNIYAGVAGRILGIRSIGAIRSDLYSEIAGDRIFGKWQIALPHHLITNSNIAFNRAITRGAGRNKFDVVRNIVQMPNTTKNKLLKKKGLKILFVGRLGNEKRPELFIKLAWQLSRDLPETDLIFQIIGDGPRRFELEKLRDDYGLSSDQVEFSGEQSDMADIYRDSDILILTSGYEGTPNVILEAMSFGIPVVATRVGGVPEILTEEVGILVDPSDFEGLVDAARNLILDRELRRRLGRSGYDHVGKSHSLTYLQNRLIGIYKKLLGTRQRYD